MAEQMNAQGTSDQQGWRGMRQVRSFLQKLILVAAAMLLWQSEAHATHAMGGELSYVCLGNNQYRVTLNFYRDCNGVAAPTNCNNGLSFNVSSSTCAANLDRLKGKENTNMSLGMGNGTEKEELGQRRQAE